MREKATNEWLSIGAYARAHGVSRATVYKWLECGLLEHYRMPPSLVRIRNMPPTDHTATSVDVVTVHPGRATSRRPAQPVARFKGRPVPTGAGVYMIRSGVTVKIGCAANLQARLQSLQAGTFTPLCVVGYIERPDKRAAQLLELDLHRQFKDERVRGEWFRLTDDILSALQQHGQYDPQSIRVDARRTS